MALIRAREQQRHQLVAQLLCRSSDLPVVRTIEPDELAAKAGYSRPHKIHCGPGGIFMSNLGGANASDGPEGVAQLHSRFNPSARVPPLVSDIDLSVDDRWLYV